MNNKKNGLCEECYKYDHKIIYNEYKYGKFVKQVCEKCVNDSLG